MYTCPSLRWNLKYTSFADDATFFLNDTKQSLQSLTRIIKEYSKVSGLKLNNSKSVILKIGASKRSIDNFSDENEYTWTSEKASTLGITFTNDKNTTTAINYDSKLKEFNTCLDNWKKYNLSLIGKITVIKTFALPKLIYPITVLELPNNEMMKNIKLKMFDFLWDGKPDKIKRETLIQSYENGGLKMIDIDIFIKTIKCSWIKRLSDQNNKGDWKAIYLRKLEKLGGIDFFECNINKEDSKHLIQKPTFLKEIVSSWADINFSSNLKHISTQKIWNNSLIKNNQNLFFNKEWQQKGIQTIGQLYDSKHKTFLTFEQMKIKFNLKQSDFLKYYQILSSIPKKWKSEIKHDTIENQQLNLYKSLMKSKASNKLISKIQLERIQSNNEIKPHKQWEKQFTNLNWKHIHSMPFECTIDTKLRAFQYKYTMRIYPTNQFLFKCNMTNSSNCDFCHMDVETIRHLFWECRMVQSFWNEIKNMMINRNIDINLNFQTVSFGNSRKKKIK